MMQISRLLVFHCSAFVFHIKCAVHKVASCRLVHKWVTNIVSSLSNAKPMHDQVPAHTAHANFDITNREGNAI